MIRTGGVTAWQHNKRIDSLDLILGDDIKYTKISSAMMMTGYDDDDDVDDDDDEMCEVLMGDLGKVEFDICPLWSIYIV